MFLLLPIPIYYNLNFCLYIRSIQQNILKRVDPLDSILRDMGLWTCVYSQHPPEFNQKSIEYSIDKNEVCDFQVQESLLIINMIQII